MRKFCVLSSIILVQIFFWSCSRDVSGRVFNVSVGGVPGTISFNDDNTVVIEAGNDSVLGTYIYSKDEGVAAVTVDNNTVYLSLDYLEGKISEKELYSRQNELAQKLSPSS